MKDCLAYFHLSPVWEKVLKGFREKYISYGRFGGKVILKNLKPTDIEELEGFFGKSFHSQKSVTVSSEKFRQALETSRYKEITPECLLENFFEEPLLGRQEQKSLREQEKERIWEIFQRDYEGTPVETALESLRSIVKDNGSQELAKWDKMLRLGAEIYNNLPYRSTKMYLAVFAAMRTGNPHAFDIGTADGNFLYQIIQMDLEIRRITVETSAIFPAYKRQKSYLLAGIMLDDVSNYTMLYQVQAVKKMEIIIKVWQVLRKNSILYRFLLQCLQNGMHSIVPKMKYILWKILRFLPCFAEKKKQIIRKKHICA